MTTIKDIARLSGYSIGTVSRVINNHADVSDAARAKITQVIQETGFQPNTNAKYLKLAGSSPVTILVKGTKNFFLETILEDIQELMKKNGEPVTVVFLDELSNEVETAAQIASERKPKGLIFLGANLDYLRQSFGNIKIPAVLVTGNASELGFENLSSFSTDDYEASKAAVGVLLNAGHTNIGIVGGSNLNIHGSIGTIRLMGGMDALKKRDITFDMERSYEPSRFSSEDGYRAAKKLLEREKGITAIFALSDTIAIGTMRAAKDLGLRIPEDLSIIGFDGIEYTKYSVPRLATVRQSSSLLAQKSVDDLLLRMNYSRKAVHEVIPFKVEPGESIQKNIKKTIEK